MIKGNATMVLRDLFFLAMLAFFISATCMLLLSITQQNATLWVRLLSVAALPAPSLALFLGTVAFDSYQFPPVGNRGGHFGVHTHYDHSFANIEEHPLPVAVYDEGP